MVSGTNALAPSPKAACLTARVFDVFNFIVCLCVCNCVCVCVCLCSQAFSGNSNSESAVRHELQQGIVARFLRLVPLDWSEEGRIGLRIEVYGCSYCEWRQTHRNTPSL